LPDVGGLQISRWVKEHRPHTPFILATGWSELVTPEDYEKGRIDAIFKSFTPALTFWIASRSSRLRNILHLFRKSRLLNLLYSASVPR